MKVVVETAATATDLLLLSCSQLKGNRVVETREGSPPQKAAPHRPPAAAHLPLQPPSLLPSSSCCCSAASLPARLPRPAGAGGSGRNSSRHRSHHRPGRAVGGRGKRGAERLGWALPPPPKRRRALRREDEPAPRRRLVTGGGRRFKPAWGWEGGDGRRKERMRHGCLCEERSGEGGGEELPGRERSPRPRDEGEDGGESPRGSSAAALPPRQQLH